MLAGPTVAYPAPARTRRSGRPRATSRRASPARTTSPGVPAVSMPCGIAEGDLPAGLQLAAAAGEDELAALRRRARSRGSRMRIERLQLDAGRGLPRARRPHRPPARLGRAARVPLARASTRSSPSVSPVEAAEPLGVPVLPALAVRPDAVLRRLPGQPDAAAGDVPARSCATCSTRCTGRASAASCSSTGTAATTRAAPRARPWRGGARRTRKRSGTTGGTRPRLGRGRGDRLRGEPRLLARELPVDATRGRRAARRAQADGRHRADARARSRRRPANCSATARSAALYQRPDETSSASGRRGWRRCATVIENGWARCLTSRGRVALVTGTAQGIGAAIAAALRGARRHGARRRPRHRRRHRRRDRWTSSSSGSAASTSSSTTPAVSSARSASRSRTSRTTTGTRSSTRT